MTKQFVLGLGCSSLAVLLSSCQLPNEFNDQITRVGLIEESRRHVERMHATRHAGLGDALSAASNTAAPSGLGLPPAAGLRNRYGVARFFDQPDAGEQLVPIPLDLGHTRCPA